MSIVISSSPIARNSQLFIYKNIAYCKARTIISLELVTKPSHLNEHLNHLRYLASPGVTVYMPSSAGKYPCLRRLELINLSSSSITMARNILYDFIN